ncbi:MAG: exodeoxyribonuclease VII small subunit [Gammaproteobacteria bacterium]|nr:exodeoxyribonuclease VII small subunit [Gammaproteobacteria bacterium]
MPKAKKIDFEASLGQLEQLVDQMEDGELSLEDSLKAFEQGVKLTRECQQALKEAEQKVQLLIEQNGELVATPFTEAEDEE